MNTLYRALVAAGIEVDHHVSDLYFPASPEALAILEQFPSQAKSAERFQNEISPLGRTWVNVPFAFDPFWEAIKTGAKQ